MVIIGAEYSHIDFTKLANGKGKKPPPNIPTDLTEEEKKFIHTNPEGEIIFTPIYEVYNETFIRGIVAGTKIQATYTGFNDTAWFEKYTTNAYQFSAAKSASTARLMQAQVYDENKKLRSWPDFRNRADEIQVTQNKNYLRVERDNCARQAILADKFNDFREDADLYPYWIYKGRMDSRERPEHRALEGLIFRIGDPYGDACFPPSDWNCRCTGKNIDDMYLRANNRKVQTNEEAKGWLEGVDKDTGLPFIDEQFRYNPADQGMLPKTGSYFEAFGSANEGDSKIFGLQGKTNPDLDSFAAQRFTDFLNIVHEWREKYHLDKLGNIVFQCESLLSNIWFTNHSIHAMHAHPRGVELLPATIADPSEVWASWENATTQQVVLRNYIQFGEKSAYIVQTRDGAIQDAFTTTLRQSDKYRKGVPYRK